LVVVPWSRVWGLARGGGFKCLPWRASEAVIVRRKIPRKIETDLERGWRAGAGAGAVARFPALVLARPVGVAGKGERAG
jgi:hypothetical protein